MNARTTERRAVVLSGAGVPAALAMLALPALIVLAGSCAEEPAPPVEPVDAGPAERVDAGPVEPVDAGRAERVASLASVVVSGIAPTIELVPGTTEYVVDLPLLQR
jgi:hypothetical protein